MDKPAGKAACRSASPLQKELAAFPGMSPADRAAFLAALAAALAEAEEKRDACRRTYGRTNARRDGNAWNAWINRAASFESALRDAMAINLSNPAK